MNRQEFEQMDSSKLLDTIQTLNKRLFKINQSSPMFRQMLNIIEEGQAVYREQLAINRYDAANEERETVINIGDVTSEVYTPDYANNTVLSHVVSMYTQELKK